MKRLYKPLALVCFGLGFVVGIQYVMSPYLKISWLPKSATLLLFFLFGAAGFTLNSLSYKQDTFGTPAGNRLHWIGTGLTFTGLVFLMLHLNLLFWGLFLIGIILMAIGFIKNTQGNQTPSDELDANE